MTKIYRWALPARRWLAGAMIACFCGGAMAENTFIHESTSRSAHKSILTIYGAADYPAISPIFDAFLAKHPLFTIYYTEFSTRALYHHIIGNPAKSPDIVMSPAMDLQIKLVNDGYAQPFQSAHTQALPEWATWRDELFGFTYEPIVVAIHTSLLAGEPAPKSRAQLANFIRDKNTIMDGKVGLSNIEKVGVGYLTWAFDSQQSRTYGRLLEVFGAHQARFYPNTTSILNALVKGDIVIGYNLLGSYAKEWENQYPDIHVIMPSDYTSVVLRSVFIPKTTQHLDDATRFVDFLLSQEGQQVLLRESSLNPILTDIEATPNTDNTLNRLRKSTRSPLLPIPLGLELLLLTDDAKRQLLLDEWHNAMDQHPSTP